MARLILDTTVLVSAERRGVTSIANEIDEIDDVAIAAVTLAELQVGVLLATGKRKVARAAYVQQVAQTFVVEDYTAAIAGVHADLLAHTKRAGRPRGAHDLIIAATAIATSRKLLTSDARGFEGLPGLALVAPEL